MLTPQQIEEFRTKGFVKGSRVLSDDEVETLRAETLRVIENQEELKAQPAGQRPVQIANITGKGENPVWQIVNIWQASEPFAALARHAQIAQEVAQLLEADELRLWHDQIQYKPAGTGGVNMWHQDSPYWPPLAPKDRQVTAWVALDDVDEENGCMRMVPGSQQWGDNVAFLHTLRDFGAMPSEFEGHALQVVSCPVEKGAVHYHHALTWHGSGANTSGRPRRAVALHYMAGDTRFNAAGGKHVMNPFIEVADSEPLQGPHFPLVYSKSS